MARKISTKRRKQIARAAKRALDKQSRKGNRSIKKIKFQTVPLWKRLLIGLTSLIFLGLSIFLFESTLEGSIFFGGLFIITLGIAVVGNKKTIDGGLSGLDAGISGKVLDGIIDNIF